MKPQIIALKIFKRNGAGLGAPTNKLVYLNAEFIESMINYPGAETRIQMTSGAEHEVVETVEEIMYLISITNVIGKINE